MVTRNDSRVIDPEFAFYGPIGFDLGAFFGNLLVELVFTTRARRRQTDDRNAYQEWILEQAKIFWETFQDTFLGTLERAREG